LETTDTASIQLLASVKNNKNIIHIATAVKEFLGGGNSNIFGIFTPILGGNDPI